MRYHFASISLAMLVQAPAALAQTLDLVTSVPAPGTVEVRQPYSTSDPPVWNTTGTGNTWNANSAVAVGAATTITYRTVPGAPHAALHTASNVCASSVTGGVPTWYYWVVADDQAEWVGVDTDVIGGRRTQCTFPFTLGDSFADSYTVFGSTTDFTMEYVASGSVQGAWGTISDVVMFSYNDGASFELYRAGNILRRIGVYVPGVQLEMNAVEVYVGITEHTLLSLALGPVPCTEHVDVQLPFDGPVDLVLLDGAGRTIRHWSANSSATRLSVMGVAPGNYLLLARSDGLDRALGRLMVSR